MDTDESQLGEMGGRGGGWRELGGLLDMETVHFNIK